MSRYLRKDDADRLVAQLETALGSLEAEFGRIVAERTTPDMTPAEIQAIVRAEIGPLLKSAEQAHAAMVAQADAAAIDIDDGDEAA